MISPETRRLHMMRRLSPEERGAGFAIQPDCEGLDGESDTARANGFP
jgi:hypothetical protein